MEVTPSLFPELQLLPPERRQRAMVTAQPVAEQIAQGALDELRFDDSPYDYPVMQQRAARE